MSKIGYLAGKQFGYIATHTFFRDIKIYGEENMPKNGPVIICSNHNNQFMDGLLLASNVKRPVRFIVAAKSMRRPLIGHIARSLGGIPVERAQDLAKNGSGTIVSISKKLLIGNNTKFTKELQEGGIINISEIQDDLIIVKIISDKEVEIKSQQEQELMPGSYKYKVIPKVDQTQMFSSVWESLNNDECIGIFPEGGSHDRTDLLPLKAGVCIMALGAMTKYNKQVCIITCGLNYFGGHKFRSKVIMEFGAPYFISQELAELYKTNKKLAIQQLLKEIEIRLKDVLTIAPSYSDLCAINLARRIYISGQQESPEEGLKLNRKFAKWYNNTAGDLQVKAIFTKIKEYRQNLRQLGIKDHEIQKFHYNKLKNSFTFIKLTFIVALLFSVALPGLILNVPILKLLSYMSEKERRKCLKASKVKVMGNDVIASYQIVLATIILPSSLILYTSLFTFACKYLLKLQNNSKILKYSLFFFILYPLYAFLMLKSSDGLWRKSRHTKAFFLLLFFGRRYSNLKQNRKDLQKELKETISLYLNQLISQNEQQQISVSDLSKTRSPLLKSTKSDLGKIFDALDDMGI